METSLQQTPPPGCVASCKTQSGKLHRQFIIDFFKRVQQFHILLWKNALLRLRNPYLLAAELIFPILFILILTVFRSQGTVTPQPACHVTQHSMPSMGLLQYAQSMICNFNFTCYPTDPDQNEKDQFLRHKFLQFLTSLDDLLSDESFHELTSVLKKPASFSMFRVFLGVAPRLHSVYTNYNDLSTVLNSGHSYHPKNNSEHPIDIAKFQRLSTFICGSSNNDLSRLLSAVENMSLNLTFVQGWKDNLTLPASQNLSVDSLRKLVASWNLCSRLQSFTNWKPILYTVGRLRHFFFTQIAYFPSNSFNDQIIQNTNKPQQLLNHIRMGIKYYFNTTRSELIDWIKYDSEQFRNNLQLCLNSLYTVDGYCETLFKWLAPSPPTNPDTLHWNRTIQYLDMAMAVVESFLDCIRLEDKFIGFNNRTEFEKFLHPDQHTTSTNPIGLLFEHNHSSIYSFHVRANPFLIDSTIDFQVVDRFWNPRPRRSPENGEVNYFTSGFIDLQDSVSQSILSGLGNSIGIEMKMFPTPPYAEDSFLLLFGPHLPQFMILAWSLTVIAAIKYMVDEREHGTLNLLEILGVPSGVSRLSWLVTSLSLILASAVPMIFILKFSHILPRTNPVLIFHLIFIYALAILCFAMLSSMCFTRSNFAAVVSGGIYFMCYLPAPILLRYEHYVPFWVLFCACLLPQVNHTFVWAYFVRLELRGTGAQWSDVYLTLTGSDGSLSLGLLLLLLSCTIGVLLICTAWIMPFIQSNYLSRDQRRPIDRSDQSLTSSPPVHIPSSPCPNSSLAPSLIIHQLTKIYNNSTSSSVALDDVNLEFYPNEVNVLMGHNGAGKSTLLSILTGTSRPTSGHVIVNNQLVSRKRSQFNRRLPLGYCPQRDILYPNLTVSQHVYFYSALRGCRLSGKRLDRVVKQFGFHNQRACLTGTLSGGQQRKLSVCLAFLGSATSIILLDEPTAGLDPLSKHIIWDLIRSLREGRTILFTSHHMREVEYLSDQVAILNRGRLCCVSSSVSLKAKYGLGYRLTIEKSPLSPSISSGILQFVRLYIRQAQLIEDLPTRIVIRLPVDGAFDGRFVHLFEQLETCNPQFEDLNDEGLLRFNITDASFEDVFHSVMKTTSDQDARLSSNSVEDSLPNSDKTVNICFKSFNFSTKQSNGCVKATNIPCYLPTVETNSTVSTVLSTTEQYSIGSHIAPLPYHEKLLDQVYVIICTRLYQFGRNKLVCFLESALPCLVLLVALILVNLYHPQIDQPIMYLHPWLLTDPLKSDSMETFISQASSRNSLLARPDLINHSNFWTGPRCTRQVNSACKLNFAPCSDQFLSDWEQIKTDSPVTQRRLVTNDVLFNLTSIDDLPAFILTRTNSSNSLLFGGLSTTVPSELNSREVMLNLSTTLFNWYSHFFLPTNHNSTGDYVNWVAFLLPPINQLRVWYNNKGYVSAPAYMNMLHNLPFQLDTNLTQDGGGLLIANHPLPFPTNKWLSTFHEAIRVEGAFALFLIIALTVIPANFAVFLVQDYQLGVRHLQRVTGLRRYLYWLIHFLWDYSIYVLTALICLIFLSIFHQHAYTHDQVIGPFLLLTLSYGIAMIPLTYLATQFFQYPSTAYVFIGATHMVLASITLSINVLLLLLIFYEGDSQTDFVSVLQLILRIALPHHCFGTAVLDLALRGFLRKHNLLSDVLPHFPMFRDMNDPWLLLSPRITILVSQGVGLMGLLLLIEYRHYVWMLSSHVYLKFSRTVHLGIDRCSNNLQPTIQIRDLFKRYRGLSHPAVDRLCLDLRAGECFGLLGMNGAGKSTTFDLLTGKFPSAPNTIRMNGIDSSVVQNHNSFPVSIGYCPQRDALHGFMTARECLSLCGRLRGLHGHQLTHSVDQLIKSIGLHAYADCLVRTYSGGTKRKLSTALAFIGDPDILLLDEPSSGMDPSARQLLWNQIQMAVNRGCIVLLSSHCVDECESLCTRVGLLVDGKLKCNDSPSNLKRQFNVGYTVDFELSSVALLMDFNNLNMELSVYLPQIQLSPPLRARQRCESSIDIPLSRLFHNLQTLHSQKLIKYFSVKCGTLEDAFVKCINSTPV